MAMMRAVPATLISCSPAKRCYRAKSSARRQRVGLSEAGLHAGPIPATLIESPRAQTSRTLRLPSIDQSRAIRSLRDRRCRLLRSGLAPASESPTRTEHRSDQDAVRQAERRPSATGNSTERRPTVAPGRSHRPPLCCAGTKCPLACRAQRSPARCSIPCTDHTIGASRAASKRLNVNGDAGPRHVRFHVLVVGLTGFDRGFPGCRCGASAGSAFPSKARLMRSLKLSVETDCALPLPMVRAMVLRGSSPVAHEVSRVGRRIAILLAIASGAQRTRGARVPRRDQPGVEQRRGALNSAP